MLTQVQQKQLGQVEITKVDPHSLVNLKAVSLDPNLPQAEKIAQYLAQIQNPYAFICDKTPVKLCFSKTAPSLAAILQTYFTRHSQS